MEMGSSLVIGKPVLSSNDMQAAKEALLTGPKEIAKVMKRMEPGRLHAFKVKVREYKHVLEKAKQGEAGFLIGAKNSAGMAFTRELMELSRDDTGMPESVLKGRKIILLGLENVPLRPQDQALLEKKAELEQEINDIFKGNENGMKLAAPFIKQYHSYEVGKYSHPALVFATRQ